MRRRTVLAGLGAGLTASAAGRVPGRGSGGSDDAPRERRASVGERTTRTLLPDTRYATEVVTVDGPRDGPTAVVVGGIHGDERCGYLAAERIAQRGVEAGRLVAIPRANRPAIERNQREGIEGDLNRKFPTGREPTTRLARAIWGVVADADPDVVVDLHQSTGIYRVHEGSVGQAIFPTTTGGAPPRASEVADDAGRRLVPWYMPVHDYRRGNRLDGSSPLLIHRVAGELGVAGYVVETTSYLVDPATRVDWETAVGERLLRAHGLVRPGGSAPDGASERGDDGGNGT